MLVRSFGDVVGHFALMSPFESARFSGVKAETLPAVRVIEDGEVRTVIEAVFSYGNSAMCLRYKLPQQGTEVEIEARVQWAEKDLMLKLAIPVAGHSLSYLGQVAYGAGELPCNGDEAVAQKWVAVVADGERALTCINDGVYGSDCSEEGLRLTLLRSPAFTGHPIGDRPIVPQDRFTARIDQGERLFRFWLNAGPLQERLDRIDREALAHNEKPMALSFFPSGQGEAPLPLVRVKDGVTQIAAAKRSEDGKALVLRLFEPTGKARTTTLELPALGIRERVKLGTFEIKTLRIDLKKRTVVETDLLEKPCKSA
jgi:alpha-mannosidase